MRPVAALFVRQDSVSVERLRAKTRPGHPARRTECTKAEREHTPPALAEWLIDLARRTRVPAAREAMAA